MNNKNFIELVLSGALHENDTHDYIEIWHSGTQDVTVWDFLGLTKEEYGQWVKYPKTLNKIINKKESVVARTASVSYDYAKNVLKARFVE